MSLVLLLACTTSAPPEPPPSEPVDAEHPGHWTRRDNLNFGHAEFSLVPTDAGVVIFGGYSNKAERWDPESGQSLRLDDAPAELLGAVGLPFAGGALYLGGRRPQGKFAAGSLAWSPETGWSTLPALSTPRSEAVGTVLDGKALVCGGQGVDGPLASCEWFDGSVSSPAPEMPGPRAGAVAVRSGEDWILVGGTGPSPLPLYRFHKGAWESWGELDAALTLHAAVAVDGGVLVIGGKDAEGARSKVLFCDGTCKEVAPLNEARAGLGAGLLGDGRVVAFGGEALPENPDALPLRSTELRTLEGTWELGEKAGQARTGAVALPLEDGTLLVVGGESRSKSITAISTFSPEDKPPRTPQAQPEPAPVEPPTAP